jgi:hypothetical protein
MQVRFEELVAQLQSGVGTSAGASVGLGAGARGAAVRPFGAYPSPQIRNDPRQSQSGDSLQLQLQPSPEDEDEIDEDEEEDEDESSGEHSPRNIAGVLTALERLKAELPGRLASADAWAPNNVGRLW